MGALSSRMAQLASALQAACPTRIVTRNLQPLDDFSEADLKRGVLALVSMAEDALQNNPGREAHYGRHRVALIATVLAASDAAPRGTVEDLEHAIVDEVKAFCRQPPPDGIDSLVMTSWRGTGQLEAPYGSVLIDLELMGE